MKGLNKINNVFFIGIGGIGMSAIARYFVSIGKNVAGYDKTPTDITNALLELGVNIIFQEEVSDIPKEFLNRENTLVVYTPAIPKNHKQLVYFQNNNFEVLKRAKVLGLITKDVTTLAVAGTHGKTTTSTILAHLLYASGEKVTAFLGGISENYNSNYISSGNEVVVVEADEFDRSFLQLYPNISAITSMDADHLDIYGTEDAIVESFNDFKELTSGTFFKINGLPIDGVSIGIEDDSTYVAKNVKIDHGGYVFDLHTPNQVISELRFYLPGHHNLKNAITAFVMAIEYGVQVEKLKMALPSFKGIQRRFSYQLKSENKVYVDDYAHHPTEIDALHQAVREMYPGKKITAIFQPHLYSRTKDFAEDFGKSLSKFDEVFLLDIYPARELPIEGVTSEWLLTLIDNKNKKLVTKTSMIEEVKQTDSHVVLTVGAGDIGAEVSSIKEALM